jgi:hypothetical protein
MFYSIGVNAPKSEQTLGLAHFRGIYQVIHGPRVSIHLLLMH